MRARRERVFVARAARARVLAASGLAAALAAGCALGGRAGLRFDLRGEHDGPGFYGGPAIALPVVPPVGHTVVVPGFSGLFTGSDPILLADATVGYGQVGAYRGGTPYTWGAGVNLGVAFGGPRVQVVGGLCGVAGQGLWRPDNGDPAAANYLLGQLCARLSSDAWLGVDLAPMYHIPLTFYR